MIVEKRGKWLVYDVNGNYIKYTTKAEAEKAAGGVLITEDKFDAIVPVAPLQEIEHGNEEEIHEEENCDQAPSHYDWIKDSKESEAEKS